MSEHFSSPLAMLATAIADRPVAVGVGTAGRPVATYCDGHTVFVEPGMAREAEIDAIVVQAALLRAGGLDPAILRRLANRRRVIGRYLAFEGWRALAAVAPILPGSALAGSAHAHAVTSSADDSLAAALGGSHAPPLPRSFGHLRPHAVLSTDRAERFSPGPPVAARGEPWRSELDDSPANGQTRSSGREVPNRLAARMAAWLRRQMGDGGAGAQGGGTGGSGIVGSSTVTDGLRGMSLGTARDVATAIVRLGAQVGVRYPEWDEPRGRYRPAWTTVNERQLRRVVHDALWPASSELRARLAQLGDQPERRRRRAHGDDLDLDAIVEATLDRRTGGTPSDRLYVETRRHARSLAVLVLLDGSGSTDEHVTGASIHDEQRRVAAALVDAHHVLGDRVAVYAFRSHGRRDVRMLRLKAFDERGTGRAFEALAALEPRGYTRLGAALRHAGAVVEHRAGTLGRLVIVLSDGIAFDDGYEAAYGEADVNAALRELRIRGIGCIALGIGDTIDSKVFARTFAACPTATAETLAPLVTSIPQLERAALRAAAIREPAC